MERKRVEEALVLSEERFRQLAEQSNDVFWFVALNPERYEYMNHAVEKIWGRPAEWYYANPDDCAAAIHPEDVGAFSKAWESCINGQSPRYEVEYRVIRPDGSICWVLDSGTPIRNKAGEIFRMSGVAKDITERKKAEEALLESEERFSGAFEQAPIGMALVSSEGRWLKVNQSICDIVGYSKAELLASTFQEITHPEDLAPPILENVRRVLAGEIQTYQMEKRYFHKDGHIVNVLLNVTLVRDNHGQPRYFISQIQDITERRRLEEQFRQSQKMEAIGQLAGGVAHDFNNILAVIQLRSDLMKTSKDITPAQLEFAEQIGAATRRAAALTSQLLMFSRRKTLQLIDMELNKSIGDTTNMLRRTLGEQIKLEFKYAMQPLFIHADAGMIDQVLLNLAVNSRDAMPDGGRLVIETSAVDFGELAASQSLHARPGSFVCLSVSDTGCGIAVENLPRIFEPFFTTKDVGAGTGLGLATVFGIVQQHHGWINVHSEPGHGTTFSIYIPRLEKISSQKIVPPAIELARGGNETILLVEDDAFLRASMRAALSDLGYHVFEAVNGVEALEVWERNRDEIHLLLTDLWSCPMESAERNWAKGF